MKDRLILELELHHCCYDLKLGLDCNLDKTWVEKGIHTLVVRK